MYFIYSNNKVEKYDKLPEKIEGMTNGDIYKIKISKEYIGKVLNEEIKLIDRW